MTGQRSSFLLAIRLQGGIVKALFISLGVFALATSSCKVTRTDSTPNDSGGVNLLCCRHEDYVVDRQTRQIYLAIKHELHPGSLGKCPKGQPVQRQYCAEIDYRPGLGNDRQQGNGREPAKAPNTLRADNCHHHLESESRDESNCRVSPSFGATVRSADVDPRLMGD